MGQEPCLRCSACCQVFGIYELCEGDNVPAYLTAETELGYRRMKTHGFHCCCLDDHTCTIYEDRPAVCRLFQPGSELCKMARAQQSIA